MHVGFISNNLFIFIHDLYHYFIFNVQISEKKSSAWFEANKIDFDSDFDFEILLIYLAVCNQEKFYYADLLLLFCFFYS
jgi:hypothetical protein